MKTDETKQLPVQRTPRTSGVARVGDRIRPRAPSVRAAMPPDSQADDAAPLTDNNPTP
ncbi:hypothetical protein [Pyxidicoccus xibeiensis]|uniref:hypothetical protein n=1 Tax=Pyxidicoccus xibeiensis TaxID=2906759 RepID=UPI0020A836B5|nr:hypothetical protein [Pyxidicoccus xibeiensis]MCP3137541.1 hypothetical protein [Pyxidicoccus xibeiensis]